MPRRIQQPEECESHTPSPEGYLQWHAWADRMHRTHIQRQCRNCGLWAIWEPRDEPLPVRISIDPNVRVRDNQTYSNFDEADGPLAVGDKVLAVWEEVGTVASAEVTGIDEEKQFAYLAVDWSGFRDDPDTGG